MSFPRSAPFSDFGGREGDATSAAFLRHVERELYAVGQTSAEPPFETVTGPWGTQISLNRATLDLRRFQLTEDLSAGSSAEAIVLYYSAENETWDVPGETFTVYDFLSSSRAGVKMRTGDKGLAKFHPDSALWELVASSPGTGFDSDFLPAKLTARTIPSATYIYEWAEQEFLTNGANGTTKSGGRSGTASAWPAYELNNQSVAVGTYVWMRRGFEGDAAIVSVTQTAVGNSLGTASAWSFYIRYATGGTFTLTLNRGTTSALAYNASGATIKTALETASGLTLSSFSGAGTLASPYTFSVAGGDYGVFFLAANASGLKDGGDFRFTASDGSVIGAFGWIPTDVGDSGTPYPILDSWECHVVLNTGNVTLTLPPSPASTYKGLRLRVIGVDLNGYTITVDAYPSGGSPQTINGANPYTISTDWVMHEFVYISDIYGWAAFS